DLEPIDLPSWLREHVTTTWKDHSRYEDVRIEIPSDISLKVIAQPALLGQAVDNLIDNAFKYSPAGSPVTVRLSQSADSAVIPVPDRGAGTAADEIPGVFAAFVRSADARQRGIAGVGLGLTVTARIIAAFGGRIDVHSEVGMGSEFAILLPNEK